MVATPRLLLVALTSLAFAACTQPTLPSGGDTADIARETSLTATPTPTPRTVQQVIQDTRPYVVRIESEACDPEDSGLGSGYLLDGRHVVTVAHVVEDARAGSSDGWGDIAVRSIVNGVSKARVVGYDRSRDLALLELKSSLATEGVPGVAPGLAFAAGKATEGDSVIALGYPGGMPLSSFQGHVVGVNRSVTIADQPLTGLLQYDASVVPGNSGGPVVNEDGKVVAMTDAGIKGTDAQNLAVAGFASQISSWLEHPVVRPLPTCPLGGSADVRSQHAEATGIARAVEDWMAGGAQSYARLSGTELARAGTQAAYEQATAGTDRTDAVLLPTVEWKTETSDVAEVTFQEIASGLCSRKDQRLTLSTAMGYWTISDVTTLSSTPC